MGFLALLLCAAVTSFAVVDSASAAACASPEYRSFDFWIGSWDAFEVSNPTVKVANNRVSRILGGCVLLEDYQGENGSHGESFSIYDAGRKVWHQNWVTNRGALLVIEGGMHGDAMVLEGVDHSNGAEKLVRGTWKPEQDAVRETAVTSVDGGKTWTAWFDMVFRRAETGTSEEAALAALDTEYQAAVKINNAAVMDRILADDFVLVTGSGKTYSKADLLEEARSGRVHYEHQEDTQQKVRIFGDFAVVTAKLWEKGTENGKAFDKTVWFSDTYVRSGNGWRYTFAQSSLAPPPQ
jgi:ketosteroid isomerase-like protein